MGEHGGSQGFLDCKFVECSDMGMVGGVVNMFIEGRGRN
jgi:hypothetical protein